MTGALLGLLLLILNLPAIAIVAICALWGRYPSWLLTPDDPQSPFGQYEETVRWVYQHLGRYAGDFYWLALRNCLYGLAYSLKPAKYKGMVHYANLRTRIERRGDGWFYWADGYTQRTIPLPLGLVLIAGWKVDNVVLDQNTPRRAVNMDFRPIFSVRTRKSV